MEKYFNFTDKTTVGGYWWVVLCNTIVSVIISLVLIIGHIIIRTSDATNTLIAVNKPLEIFTLVMILIFFLWAVATLVPNAAILVRRFRDAELSPWYGLLVIVRLVISFMLAPVVQLIFVNMVMYMIYRDLITSATGNSMISYLFAGVTPMSKVLMFLSFVITIFFFVVSLLPSKKSADTTDEIVADEKPVVEAAAPEAKETVTAATAKKAAPKKTTAAKTTTKKATPKKTATKETK